MTLYVDADGVPRCPLCQMPMNGETESHLPDCRLRVLQESYANALVAAAVEACARAICPNCSYLPSGPKYQDGKHQLSSGEWIPCKAASIRSTVTLEAAAKELGRIKAEARLKGRLEQFQRMKNKRPIDPSYWDMHEEKNLVAALEVAEKLAGAVDLYLEITGRAKEGIGLAVRMQEALAAFREAAGK